MKTEDQEKASKKVDRTTVRYKATNHGKIDPRMLKEKTLSVGCSLNHRDVSLEKYKAGIEDLAQSIIADGILNPYIIFFERGSDVPYVKGGHRRRLASLRALELLEEQGKQFEPAYERIINSPCHVDTSLGKNEADHVWEAWKLNDSVKVTKLEKSRLVKTLLRLGMTQEQIATKMLEADPEASKQSIETQVEDAIILSEATRRMQDHVAAFEAGEAGASASMVIDEIKKRGVAEADVAIDIAVDTAKSQGRRRATVADIGPGEKTFLTKKEGQEAIELLQYLYNHMTERKANLQVLASNIEAFLTNANVSCMEAKK